MIASLIMTEAPGPTYDIPDGTPKKMVPFVLPYPSPASPSIAEHNRGVDPAAMLS